MLDKILEYKKEFVKQLKEPASDRIKNCIIDVVESVKNKPFITEVKKASPSLGDIDPSRDAAAQAKIYESAGAGAVSVLTDEKFFKGCYADLNDVSSNIAIPALCKDFIISEVQINHAYVNGADFILLIAEALTSDKIQILSRYARKLGLNVLFEIHAAESFEKLKGCDLDLVGVNNRNLQTLEIDKIAGAKTLAGLHGSFLKVAESGIETVEHIKMFADAGADAYLIGSSLMKADDPKALLKSFCGVL